ncbi:MAG: LEA type 2 family protein, partial [Gemmatimonadota bacterium]
MGLPRESFLIGRLYDAPRKSLVQTRRAKITAMGDDRSRGRIAQHRIARPRSGGGLALALAIAATGCAALESLGILALRFESADDRGTELRVLGPSAGRPLGGAALRLWAHVENPNGFGLRLTEVAGDLSIADAGAIKVEFPLGLPLVAYQDTVVPLDVSIGFDDLPALGRIASAAIAGERLDYRLDGTFAVDAGRYGEPRFGPWT